jgi:hypothetical protein
MYLLFDARVIRIAVRVVLAGLQPVSFLDFSIIRARSHTEDVVELCFFGGLLHVWVSERPREDQCNRFLLSPLSSFSLKETKKSKKSIFVPSFCSNNSKSKKRERKWRQMVVPCRAWRSRSVCQSSGD